MAFRVRLTALLWGALVAATSGAQRGATPDQAQPPVFRGGVEAVQVDVFVTDEHDRPVPGLTRDDFEVFENDQAQVINTFAHVDIPLERAPAPLFGAEPDVQTNIRPDGHVYMFVLGGTSEENALRARHLMRSFLADHFADNDIGAVITGRTYPGDRQDFTSNRRLLLNAVDRFDGKALDMVELINLMELASRIPGGRKSVVWFGGPGGENGDGIDAFKLIDYNGGVLSLAEERAHAAMSVATRANIRFFLIDPAGLTLDLANTSNPRALAEMTGGFATVNTNSFDEAFARIVSQTSTYYVLGFNSSGEKAQGRYVNLDVRVKRPGLKVKARSGYLLPSRYIRDVWRSTPEPARTPVGAALANPLYTPGIGMRVSAAVYRRSGRAATVALTIDIEAGNLAFTEKDGVHSAPLEIRHLATDVNHEILPEYRERTTITLAEADYRRMQATGLRVISQFETSKRSRYQVRVAASSAERNGSVVVDVEVPDFSEEPLVMAGLSLASQAEPNRPTLRPGALKRSATRPRQCRSHVCPSTVVFESPLAPWLATASPPDALLLREVLPTPPTTSRDFPPDDTLTIFTEVYDNTGRARRDPPYTIDLTARIVGADGDVLRVVSDSRPARATRRPSGGHGFTLRLPLERLAAGQYVLQLEAAATGREPHTVTRSIPIRVTD
jgi:VWFA-related protein